MFSASQRDLSAMHCAAALLMILTGVASSAATDVTSDILVDTTFYKNLGPYVFKRAIIIKSEATLIIEAGTEIRCEVSNTYILKVEGTLKVMGTNAAKVRFVVASTYKGQANGIDTHTGNVNIQHADFRYFSSAMNLYCCYTGQTVVEDSYFEGNSLCFAGYSGNDMHINRCHFRRNTRVMTSSDKRIVDSIFEENECGICGVERFSVYNSVFKNHTNFAISGRGNVIKGCTIIHNYGGYDEGNSASCTVENNLFAGNTIGIRLYGTSAKINNNNIGGNTEWNIYFRNEFDFVAGSNYFGSSDASIAKSYIRDGYLASGVGRVILSSVAPSIISGAGDSQYQYLARYLTKNPNYNPLPPLEMGNIFDSLHWKLGTYTFSVRTVIYTGATLTIGAGVQVLFNQSSSLVVKGKLLVEGSATSPVLFRPVNGTSNSFGINTDTGKSSISHALFDGFSTAIRLRCCHTGLVEINDSEFTNNEICVAGYMGTMTKISRTKFHKNRRVFDSADKEARDCTFTLNQCAFCGVERSSCYNCVFENHTSTAVAGRGGDITGCLFQNNKIALQGSFRVSDNLFLNNVMALWLTSSFQSVNGNDFCGTQEWNVDYSHDSYQSLPYNYWGSTNMTVVRSSIRDAYQKANVGLLDLGQLPSGPVSTKGRLLPECKPSTFNKNFSLDDALKFGNILENTTWSSGERVISRSTTILPGVTLTINAGVRVVFHATLKIVGSLLVLGTSNNPVVFSAGAKVVGINGDTGNTIIKYAIFDGFSSAISLRCCHQGHVEVNDTVFTNNGIAVYGYMGTMAYFRRCRFENNVKVCTNADKIFEDCVFNSNTFGVCCERHSVYRSLFVNHTFAIQGRGGDVIDCVFVNNGVAYQSAGYTFRNNVVTGNRIGVQYRSTGKDFTHNMVCGNNEWNLQHTDNDDASLDCNWLGAGSALQARKKIQDGYSGGGIGTVDIHSSWLTSLPNRYPNISTLGIPVDQCINKPCNAERDCSSNGLCTVDGSCKCLIGWTGTDCSICELGLQSTETGPKCTESCEQIADCATCLTKHTCVWCRMAHTSVCTNILNSTLICDSRQKDMCQNEDFNVSQAIFERTGTIVSVKFNMPTDRAGFSNVFFPCDYVLSLETVQTLGNGFRCRWSSARQLVIFLGSTFRLRPQGLVDVRETNLTFRAGSVLSNITGQALQRVSVSVSPPVEIPKPTVAVKVPTFIGTCGDLFLDGSNTYDPTAQLNAMWVCEEGCSEDIRNALLSIYCDGSGCTKSQQCIKKGDDSLSIIIPRALLKYGETYQFRLHVSNLFGFVVSSDLINVTVTTKPALLVRMLTPVITAKRLELVEIRSQVKLPECGFQSLPKLRYSWLRDTEVYVPLITNNTTQKYKGLLAKKSSLFILPDSLGYNPNYTNIFNVRVEDDTAQYESGTASAVVRVVQQPLQLFIVGHGGSFVKTQNITMEAIGKDPMSRNQSLGEFTWKCFTREVTGALVDCPGNTFVQVEFLKGPVLSLIVPANGFQEGQYEFAVLWMTAFRTVTATADIRIRGTPTLAIQILEPLEYQVVNDNVIIAKDDQIRLSANYVTASCSFLWRVYNNNTEVSVDTRTYNSSDVYVIKSGSLEEGSEYLISLTLASHLGTSEATIRLVVEYPPRGGVLDVNPCKLSVAGETEVSLRTRGWRNSNSDATTWELRYLFGYTTGDKTVRLTSQFTTNQEFSTRLPSGTLMLWVIVRSPSGSTARAEQECTVSPSSGDLLNSLTTNIDQGLDNLDEVDSSVAAAAIERDRQPLEKQNKVNKLLVEAKSGSIQARADVPPSSQSLAKDVSDMSVILDTQSSFDNDTVEKAADVLKTLSQNMKEDVLINEGIRTWVQIVVENLHESWQICAYGRLLDGSDDCSVTLWKFKYYIATNAINSIATLSRNRVNSSKIQSSMKNVEDSLSKLAVTDGRPVSVAAGGVNTIVHRITNTTNVTISDETGQTLIKVSEVLDTNSISDVSVTYTRWPPGKFDGICIGDECINVTSELISVRMLDMEGGEELNITNSTRSFTIQVPFSPNADVNSMNCVSTQDGRTLSPAGCTLTKVDQVRFLAECQCNHLTYFGVTSIIPEKDVLTTPETVNVSEEDKKKASVTIVIKGTKETFDSALFQKTVAKALNDHCTRKSCVGSSNRREVWNAVTADDVKILSVTQKGDSLGVVFYVKTGQATLMKSDNLYEAMADPDVQKTLSAEGFSVTSVQQHSPEPTDNSTLIIGAAAGGAAVLVIAIAFTVAAMYKTRKCRCRKNSTVSTLELRETS